jgi:hypothetical protein
MESVFNVKCPSGYKNLWNVLCHSPGFGRYPPRPPSYRLFTLSTSLTSCFCPYRQRGTCCPKFSWVSLIPLLVTQRPASGLSTTTICLDLVVSKILFRLCSCQVGCEVLDGAGWFVLSFLVYFGLYQHLQAFRGFWVWSPLISGLSLEWRYSVEWCLSPSILSDS